MKNLLSTICITLLFVLAAQSQPISPVLRIETEMHTAVIKPEQTLKIDDTFYKLNWDISVF